MKVKNTGITNMSSAINAFSMIYSATARINAGNNLLSNANAMNQNTANASRNAVSFGSEADLSAIHKREKALMQSNLTNSLLYKIASAQEDSLNKNKDKKAHLNYLA